MSGRMEAASSDIELTGDHISNQGGSGTRELAQSRA